MKTKEPKLSNSRHQVMAKWSEWHLLNTAHFLGPWIWPSELCHQHGQLEGWVLTFTEPSGTGLRSDYLSGNLGSCVWSWARNLASLHCPHL